MDFVLVHGTTQSPLGWARLQGALERRGHRGVAVDLATEEPMANVDDYARLAATQVGACDAVAVVAHSGSGTLLPAIAEVVDAIAIVWLAAYIPDFITGRSLNDEIQHDPTALFYPEWIGVDHAADPAAARRFLFHDPDPKLQEWAMQTLRAFVPVAGYQHKPSSGPPKTASTVIASTHDRTLRPEWIRRAAAERLSARTVLIAAGHCPHVSRAESVADVLAGIAMG